MTNLNKAVFFDRDGVLNKERKDYVKIPSELEIFSGIVEPIKKLKEADFIIVVITNQSAINRRLTTHKNISDIHSTIQKFLQKNGTQIDHFYYCPHKPDDYCQCRKPKPGMFFKAAEDLQLNLQLSWMIGNSDTDIQAANAAGCKSFKISSNHELQDCIQKILNSKH